MRRHCLRMHGPHKRIASPQLRRGRTAAVSIPVQILPVLYLILYTLSSLARETEKLHANGSLESSDFSDFRSVRRAIRYSTYAAGYYAPRAPENDK